ncbi:glycosyltransferase family 4 protein [Microbacterium esteraromaticum]|uniref:glycosyltransferase family 4 protein n=1 Tax=Microbacterium esteraromaticum TaxID=57043 RepID=UPI002367DD01|nr:glycosyltransferase family 4 protein [Microbacterium esteraromaticum]WDH79451.1 glycosyltransferase family 4 protein [Microbacterium esteraromaticum]
MSEIDRLGHALWVVPVGEIGGVARHVLDATRVGVPGWRLTVLCPEGALAERLRAQGSDVVVGDFGPQAGAWASRRTLASVARDLQPDIVHSHLAYADIVNAWTRLPRGTRRYTTEHGIAGDDGVYHASGMHARAMALIHRARFPRFDGVIAVSRATRDTMLLKWRVRRPIFVILNGVDPVHGAQLRRPTSRTGTRVLSLSRLASEKRIDKLIEAFALVLDDQPDATLVVAGEGPLRADLEHLASQLGVGDRVHFPGFVDPEDAMQAADVLVQLSIWENCSYTLLDAKARALRVVASHVGGNAEILDPTELVRDITVRSVAKAIRYAKKVEPSGHPTTNQMCAAIARSYGAGAGNA